MAVTSGMNSFCMGHHLIDLPVGFSPMMPMSARFRLQMPNAPIVQVSFIDGKTSPARFALAVQARRIEFMSKARNERNVLQDVPARGASAELFRILEIKDSYASELHFLVGESYLSARAESYEGRFDDVEASLDTFEKNVKTTVDAKNHSGFCLGSIEVLGVYSTESTAIAFRNDARPDILITIDIDTYGLNEPGTLLERLSAPNSLLQVFDTRHQIIRQGDVEVAGMRGQEWLGSVRLGEERTEKQFGFAFETRRSIPGPAAPRIHIELDTGQSDPKGERHLNSLTDQQAIAMWDSIIGSIRARPNVNHQ